MFENNSLQNTFIQGLACAAIHPGLRTVLVLDASFDILANARNILSQMLKITEGDCYITTFLGSYENEEDIWGKYSFAEGGSIRWIPGPLSEEHVGNQRRSGVHLIYIPNLALLNLSLLRACVMAVGSEIIHLERFGKNECWQPNICWLAGCASKDAGKVSPHLMDRFFLRLVDDHFNSAEDQFSSNFVYQNNMESDLAKVLDNNSVETLKKASAQLPFLSEEALSCILDYDTQHSFRREITLGRIAVAIATLSNSTFVTPDHIHSGAAMLNFKSLKKHDAKYSKPADVQDRQTNEWELKDDVILKRKPPEIESIGYNPSLDIDDEDGKTEVYQPSTEKTIPPSLLKISDTDSYPEDAALIEREYASLRLPPCSAFYSIRPRGTIIGYEKGYDLNDLAIVNTIFEAAKYQKIRPKRNCDSITISLSDLRKYRREPIPGKMLVVLVDYTCLSHCEWQQELLENHLKWAYQMRASISIIRVGAAKPTDFIRAELFKARNILVPQIIALLFQSLAGKSTPLAHGLYLAHQTLRHNLQHGRNIMFETRLIVITDGRGNVPLEASLKDEIPFSVNREGIDDSIRIGIEISKLDRLQTFLLNPRPQYHEELPIDLAKSLGAFIIDLPLKNTETEKPDFLISE